ncbi:protoporphyrinogen oxidase, partial [PVC group bacterium]|nr:protoporphyrinogen oxidase [PVC group bacterium]
MRIAILGAGISGLTLGYYLKESQPGCEIEIFEKSARVGGNIRTVKQSGFVFEQGPRGVRPKGKGAEVLELSHDVGLGSEVIFANKEASVRYIYCDRSLHKAPLSLGSVITSPLTRGWMKALWKDVTAKPYNVPDETLGSFSRRRFGESITQNIIDPLASGVWAGDIERLSFHSVFPALANIESKHGSFIKGWARKHNGKSQKSKIKSALFSFRHGMQMLPYYLSRRLEKNLRLSTPIEDLTFSDGKFRLYSQGVSWSFDKVITTLPAYQNATLLTEAHDELIRNLKDIEYAPLAIVSLGFDRKVNPYRGFGYLVPHQEREMILGAVWNDQTFREHSDNNASSMTVMIGG